MSVSLKSGQKLLPRFFNVPPISEEKSFTNFAASSKPFDETEYQARSGVPEVTPSVNSFSRTATIFLNCCFSWRGTADEFGLLLKRFEQFLPLTRRLTIDDADAILHDRRDRSVERSTGDILLDVR